MARMNAIEIPDEQNLVPRDEVTAFFRAAPNASFLSSISGMLHSSGLSMLTSIASTSGSALTKSAVLCGKLRSPKIRQGHA